MRRVLGLLVLGLCLVAGCREKEVRGDESVYAFAPWVAPVVILAGIVATPAGWFLRKKTAKIAWIMMILGPVAVLFIGPSVLMDKAYMDAQRFEMNTGFWFAPSRYHVRFDDLREVHWVVEEDRRGISKVNLECVLKSGQRQTIPVNDLLEGDAVTDLLERIRRRGIPIIGLK